MRLLPARTDHAGCGAAQVQAEPFRRRHRPDHERMPVRYVLPDPQGDQTRRLDVKRDSRAPGGLLLAAGAGRRTGRPKALVDDWLIRGVAKIGSFMGYRVTFGATARGRVD